MSLPTGIWKLDTTATTITTTLKKLGVITVAASLQVSASTIAIVTSDEGDVGGSINVEVDAASYKSSSDKRNEHVRGADFLDAARHPTFQFVGTSMEETDEGYRVKGELTVQGRTTAAEFVVTNISSVDDHATFEATTVLDRRVLGITKMPSFVISDAVAVSVNARATRQ